MILASYITIDDYESGSKNLVTTMIYGKAKNGDASRDWEYDDTNGVVRRQVYIH